MLGKTHMAVGIATSLLILQPDSMDKIVIGTGAAAVGSLISDIDVGTSESHKDADKIIATSFIAVLAVIAVEKIWNIGITERIASNSTLLWGLVSAAVFLAVCGFGKNQPHRSFMHSILALAILSGCVNVFMPVATTYFGVAFASHLAIDLLNKKGERLLFPLSIRFSLGICSSKGLVNWVLFAAGCAMSVYAVMQCLLRLF